MPTKLVISIKDAETAIEHWLNTKVLHETCIVHRVQFNLQGSTFNIELAPDENHMVDFLEPTASKT